MNASYESAAFLLRHSSIPDIDLYCDDFTELIRFDALHKERLSSGEQIIVEAASALYGGWALCSLGEATRVLDDRMFAVLVEAMRMRRPECFGTNLVDVA